MDINNMFSLMHEFQNSVNTNWNFYSMVAIGIVGYVMGSERAKKTSIKFFASIGFLIFSIGNFDRIYSTQKMYYAAAQSIIDGEWNDSVPVTLANAIPHMGVHKPISVAIFHISLSVVILSVIWIGPKIKGINILTKKITHTETQSHKD